MKTFLLISAQTGTSFGEVLAEGEGAALDFFARSKGFVNRAAMWAADRFVYVSAVQS